MYLLVGLGNPGAKYEGTRHNIGFALVDQIIQDYNIAIPQSKFKGELTKGDISGQEVILLKPHTYMNNSGLSVLQCCQFYKIKPENVWVIHDELDLEIGQLRVKQGGGNGGHNGLKSIDKHIGNNYNRIRVGISRPEHKSGVSNYVLSDFSAEQLKLINIVKGAISNNIDLLLSGNKDKFLSLYNEQVTKEL